MSDEPTETAGSPANDEPEQMRVRREKLERIKARGVEPFPVGYPRTATIAEVRERFQGLETDTATGQSVAVAGRVLLSRIGGKLCFATIREGEAEIQVMVSLDRVGEQALADWKADVDLGDHVGVTGEVITSRRGELSILADSWQMTAKCLRPLPDKHKGLSDPEARVRQRYVDLIVNADARSMMRQRSAMIRSIRETMHGEGYIEVETPVLQTVHGGASARPFRTHINAYDMDMYLRIATELPLKRLIVGGADRVFEIGRLFRNEGADATHNPEFTTIECYEAYGDYRTQAELTRQLILNAAVAVNGTTVIRGLDAHGVEHELDLAEPWGEISVYDGISERLGEPVTPETPVERLRELADKADVPYEPKWGHGQIVLEMIERLLEEDTIAPTFLMDYPTEVSPLARRHRTKAGVSEKWDLVILGTERATAFSELTDPIDQRDRLTAQSLLAAAGDEEAMQLDEDFLRALEYGMPPSGGMGMGMDRLIMMLTGKNIRETILFPLVRPGA
ncbi:MAG TPA: bifunctional lysylphosphatidylglycerol synthetase/lysine--tRNA ligase LysX [Actinocrinis sp.]|uniref:bifunctional lysylphosphatidylglycerol synthetase/lysine--tRNA ligase LysX n=1 Tax=Actinocrinis sp. TaxID=1920516 RepID=UPI002DDCDD43|nr:bifunctional lysylphosphatidylglycerol synthetase/lysine--tRNA ligase LysX [Actinocrinis sp.]HEV2343904.1 bifunctional lysylphosphatidylglycerol synthetase/lysine--tRNA ligase LysX [Actinocrinis sp.]